MSVRLVEVWRGKSLALRTAQGKRDPLISVQSCPEVLSAQGVAEELRARQSSPISMLYKDVS